MSAFNNSYNIGNGLVPSDFEPAWWLPGTHSQTLWPFLFRSHRLPAFTWERLELADGDFLDLAWHGPETSRQLCIMLHGLEGCYRSHYLPGLVYTLGNDGWRVVVMHFRGCSGTVNRLARSYHSGETGDLRHVVRLLRQREQPDAMTAVGFSLGGNVLLKYLGECGSTDRDSELNAACAVSVPFDLAAGAARLNRGGARLYQWWLVAALRRKMRAKFARIDSPIDINRLRQQRTFHQFDGYITAPLHGFQDADDYYNKSSSKSFLKAIRTPTLILQAADDPFLERSAIPAADELSSSVRFELSRNGGHVGFVSGRFPWRPVYWLDQRIPAFLSDFKNASPGLDKSLHGAGPA